MVVQLLRCLPKIWILGGATFEISKETMNYGWFTTFEISTVTSLDYERCHTCIRGSTLCFGIASLFINDSD